MHLLPVCLRGPEQSHTAHSCEGRHSARGGSSTAWCGQCSTTNSEFWTPPGFDQLSSQICRLIAEGDLLASYIAVAARAAKK